MSTSQNKRFVALEMILRESNSRIIKGIETISESEIDKILSQSEFRLSFIKSIFQQDTVETITTQPTEKKARKKVGKTTDEIIQIAERLKNTNSREEGRAIILNEDYTVKQLVLLAKHLAISSTGLKKADLIEKIIQETIGSRIDSMIILEHKWDK